MKRFFQTLENFSRVVALQELVGPGGAYLGFIGHLPLAAITDDNQGPAAQKDRQNPVFDDKNQLAAMNLTRQSTSKFKKILELISVDCSPAAIYFPREYGANQGGDLTKDPL